MQICPAETINTEFGSINVLENHVSIDAVVMERIVVTVCDIPSLWEFSLQWLFFGHKLKQLYQSSDLT